MTLFGFLFSLAVILVISRTSLPIALMTGAVMLGLICLPFSQFLASIGETFTDPNVLILSLSMGIIPILGGTMKSSGQIDSLIENLRINRKSLLAVSAAIMGLLPMPGGALLSAPILEKAGKGVEPELVAAINNWFRHLFILAYPLSPALIASAKMSNLDVYRAILYLLPSVGLAILIGYAFLLRRVNGEFVRSSRFSLPGLLIPLCIILAAPVLDFTLKRVFDLGIYSTLVGVSTAVILSILLSKQKLNLKEIVKRMRPWNFGMIILAMFLYLNIFQQTDVRQVISGIPLPPLMLAIIAGFILGLSTGRVLLPASIIIPVYLASGSGMSYPDFALIYTALFFGYIISPVHPCLVVTAEYFGIGIRRMMTRLMFPTVLMLGLVLLGAIFTH